MCRGIPPEVHVAAAKAQIELPDPPGERTSHEPTATGDTAVPGLESHVTDGRDASRIAEHGARIANQCRTGSSYARAPHRRRSRQDHGNDRGVSVLNDRAERRRKRDHDEAGRPQCSSGEAGVHATEAESHSIAEQQFPIMDFRVRR